MMLLGRAFDFLILFSYFLLICTEISSTQSISILNSLNEVITSCKSFSCLRSKTLTLANLVSINSSQRLSQRDLNTAMPNKLDFDDVGEWHIVLDNLSNLLELQPQYSCTLKAKFKHQYLGIPTKLSQQMHSDTSISIAKQYQTCLTLFIQNQSKILLEHMKKFQFHTLGTQEMFDPIKDCINDIRADFLAPLGSSDLIDWKASLLATSFLPIINEPNCTFFNIPSKETLNIQKSLATVINQVILKELIDKTNSSLVYSPSNPFVLESRKSFLLNTFNDVFTCEILPDVLSIFNNDSSSEMSLELSRFAYSALLMDNMFHHGYPINSLFYLFPTLTLMTICVEHLRNNMINDSRIEIQSSINTIARSAKTEMKRMVIEAKNRPKVYSFGWNSSSGSVNIVTIHVLMGCFVIIFSCI